MDNKKSELTVVTRAKELCSYVMVITQKSPKQFRFTFVSRMQNLALSIIENIFRANDIFIQKGDTVAQRQRLEYQHRALTELRILSYISQLAMEQKCILLKQFEMISKYTSDCMKLIGAWIISDRKRLQP